MQINVIITERGFRKDVFNKKTIILDSFVKEDVIADIITETFMSFAVFIYLFYLFILTSF